MFNFKVDDDIKLALVHESFAPKYLQLVQANYDYLERWLAWPPHMKSEDNFKTFIRNSLHDYADGKSMVCGILYHGELVGNVSYNLIDRKLKKVELGYWIALPYQGKGIMTRVCRTLIELAFQELDMEKVQISAAVGNSPSRAVCERLGLTLEGIITNAENLNGRIVDHAVYGVRRSDNASLVA